MGLSKCVVVDETTVKFVHQLNDDGTPYAEDVIVVSDVPGRLDWLKANDGKIGVLSFGFSPYTVAPEGIKFP